MPAMNEKGRWSTQRIPPGDAHAPYIKQSLSKNTDGTYSYVVYRNMKVLGAPKSLEKAQALAKAGKRDAKAMADMQAGRDYMKNTPGDADAFKKLSEINQKWIAAEFPWFMPKKRDMEAKGIKTPKVTERTNLLSTKEKAVARGGKFDLDATIHFHKPNDPNPRKAGTQQWTRGEILKGHHGKTA